MSSPTAHTSKTPTDVRRVALASLVGTTIEWYDFFLYALAAVIVFRSQFFPGVSPLAGTLATLGTFAVGFVARPLGGIVFGHIGDKIGRKMTLVTTLVTMGVATFLIGLLPTYEQIGVAAPVLLVVLRIAQGLAVGGEWGGAVLISVEHAPEARRGFYGAFPQLGVPLGMLLASGVTALMTGVIAPGAAFLEWGWRVPFLLSIVLIGVGLFIRLRIMETPAFTQVKESGTEAPMPILDVLRTYP